MNMMLKSIIIVLFSLTLNACGDNDTHGPAKIVWDRDACEHCRMVLSDRYYAAQIRNPLTHEVSKFDDLGCALIWLEQQSWKDNSATEIWITDATSGAWLDARQAYYRTNNITPMDYGLAAGTEKTPGSLDFEAAKAHIFAK
jgi:copper chaperone NosL